MENDLLHEERNPLTCVNVTQTTAKEHTKMPKVGGKHYPYTEAGIKQAKAEARRQKKKQQKSKKSRR